MFFSVRAQVLGLLKSRKVNDKISVSDFLFELSKVLVYGYDGSFLEIPKFTDMMMDATGIRNLIVKNG
jgi:hypothetical protein